MQSLVWCSSKCTCKQPEEHVHEPGGRASSALCTHPWSMSKCEWTQQIKLSMAVLTLCTLAKGDTASKAANRPCTMAAPALVTAVASAGCSWPSSAQEHNYCTPVVYQLAKANFRTRSIIAGASSRPVRPQNMQHTYCCKHTIPMRIARQARPLLETSL